MPNPAETINAFSGESSQALFHRRWSHLRNPHVRALAWLLDAPDLLDAAAPQWGGRIASLATEVAGKGVGAWLSSLDADPSALHAALLLSPATRLGRYAESLLAFYFAWRGILFAHGLQVRIAREGDGTDGTGSAEASKRKGKTVGEFDFLLWDDQSLLHLELATKFYLFEQADGHDPGEDFIGPNLADTLGAKMHKILHRQLALATHPAAQAYLPQAVARSQALIKGWLFYPANLPIAPAEARGSPGVAQGHCRGIWCSLATIDQLDAPAFLPLARLSWLAPARAENAAVLDQTAIRNDLHGHFANDTMPMLVALMAPHEGAWYETNRCFIVPDDWRTRVHERNQRTVLQMESDVRPAQEPVLAPDQHHPDTTPTVEKDV